MKTEVILRVRGVKERHVVNARNSHSAGGMALQRLSPRICRLREVKIVSIIGLPTNSLFSGYHDKHLHTNHSTK